MLLSFFFDCLDVDAVADAVAVASEEEKTLIEDFCNVDEMEWDATGWRRRPGTAPECELDGNFSRARSVKLSFTALLIVSNDSLQVCSVTFDECWLQMEKWFTNESDL